MTEFETRYRSLNENQKKAVDMIDGPLMVVAGPGTGKTELLSMRVANILKKTDTLGQNILCLTFTESGASAMRERLVSLLGPEAYKVAVHTFHSFGTEIINQYGEYFYQGAHFRPADQLSSYEALVPILDKLPHTNPIAGKMNGAFTHLSDIQSTISDLKKSGLTPDEVGMILDRNDAFIAWVQPRLNEVFADRLSKKVFLPIKNLLEEIGKYQDEALELISYIPLHSMIAESLELALTTSEEENSTKPLSAWKRTYLEKDAHGDNTLKDAKRSIKLRATLSVYYEYLVAMQERSLYDFDDMILRVVHALEVFTELRLNLQEQYQYILVDEFQDTNDAQMRLIWNLTNNPTQNGRPNIMVVGDDDQAIYRFQGAKISNILDFKDRYDNVAIITLKDNYRSAKDILELARSVIVQGEERLERTLESVDKSLTPHHAPASPIVGFEQFPTEAEEYAALADKIRAAIIARPEGTRAIIARHHRQLLGLLPYLQSKDIPLRYERQEDVLESEPIVQLELLARIIYLMSSQQFSQADELMPRLLAHPAWGISSTELWHLSLDAHRNHQLWCETMLETTGKLKDIAEWLIISSHLAQHETLEFMLDHLFGALEPQEADTASDEIDAPFADGPHENFISPLRAFFFPVNSLETHPGRYMAHLSALQKLRHTLREYRPDMPLKLEDLINCIDLHRELGIAIQGGGEVFGDENAVMLLTAHRSKGLEFDEVYIIDATDTVWGDSARSHSRLISFPHNLPLAPAGDNSDERLRLLYVGLTRAKDQLHISLASQNSGGKSILPAGAFTGTSLEMKEIESSPPTTMIKTLLADWRTPVYDVALTTAEQLLRPILERYRLSATHLNNFLDVSKGGPQLFLLQNLLRFPQAMSPSAAYGSSVHGALQRAHAHLSATGKRRPVEDVLHDFEELLNGYQLSEDEENKMLLRGSEALQAFLAARYDSFTATQSVERNFNTETIQINDARVTGAIDLMDIDEKAKTITVTDYKTGRAVGRWQGRTEYEKIKLHHYEQQLMLYKLLIENSRQFTGYTVLGGVIEFVEPDEKGEIVRLMYEYSPEKLAEFTILINAVWKNIQALSFSSTDQYDPTLKGILSFENDLVTGIDPHSLK